MTRRCSHCGHNGHNSRTCPDRGVRLFGVRLTDGVMRKSASMGNLCHYATSNNPPSTPEHSESGAANDGYVSDGLVQTSSNARERKKGVPWTEEEHRLFLLGLQKLGKGDWRGISRNFVQSRTPTQVASHAQKYFIRQSNLNKRKRRSSLFDIVSETAPHPTADDAASKATDIATPLHQLSLGQNSLFSSGQFFDSSGHQGFGIPVRPFAVPPLNPLTAMPPLPVMSLGGAGQGAESTISEFESKPVLPRPASSPSLTTSAGVGLPAIPYSFPLWPGLAPQGYGRPAPSSAPPTYNKLVRPTASVASVPIKSDESPEIARLTLGLSPPSVEPSPLTLKLLEQPSRHSAFHANSSFSGNSLSSSGETT
eukprot:TRINITY_DN1619_c0_g1_i2.p1 TRINITY_DN1619_c0_g1~~TRINITY_DN1619_c0_g1_i2.p1  ORF type:complete len:367 (-),score=20.66 TRINITY_DN1619_c0_g1_i2:449-1549(-)